MFRRNMSRVLLLVGALAVGYVAKCEHYENRSYNVAHSKPKDIGSLHRDNASPTENSIMELIATVKEIINNVFSVGRKYLSGSSTVATSSMERLLQDNGADIDTDTVESSESFMELDTDETSESPPTELDCLSLNSCKTCAANPKCEWCGGKLSVSVPKIKISNDFTVTGTCRPITDTSCADVKFGDFQKTLNKKVELFWVTWATIGFEVVPVKADSPQCTAVRYPEEVTDATCSDCVSRGYTWCNIDTRVNMMIKSLSIVSPKTCLRPEMAFLCNKEIIPSTSGLLYKIFSKLFKVDMRVATNASECGRLVAPALPLPKHVCSDNHSCDTCSRSTASDGCTWCGGKLSFKVKSIGMSANVQGVCLPGREANCDAVKFGTLNDATNSLPGGIVKFDVVSMDKSNSEKNYCTSVQWDPRAADTCLQCSQHPNSGWCQIDGTGETLRRIFGKKTTHLRSHSNEVDVTEPSDTGFHGGMCIPEGLSFTCSSFIPGITASYMEQRCPNKDAVN